jgi:hypothetical protein
MRMGHKEFFELWWTMFGSKFDQKLGRVGGATKKELAEYAFNAGMVAERREAKEDEHEEESAC